MSCTVSQQSAVPSNGRKSKKDKAQPPPSEPLLEVILHDTIIFPEGGGQPSDIGILTSEDGELWNVIEVKRHGGHAVHYVRARDANAESALRVFTPGSRVGVALGEDGVKRRLDHVRQAICFLVKCDPDLALDEHAHIATLAICRYRDPAKLTHSILVSNGLPGPVLC